MKEGDSRKGTLGRSSYAPAMYFSLRLHMLPRLPVLPVLPGQRMRVTQVVRRPPSEPTNGRPCSLLSTTWGWSHWFHWCHWCLTSVQAAASASVRSRRLRPSLPSQLSASLPAPSTLKLSRTPPYESAPPPFTPWPWPPSRPLPTATRRAWRRGSTTALSTGRGCVLLCPRGVLGVVKQLRPSTGGCTPAPGAP